MKTSPATPEPTLRTEAAPQVNRADPATQSRTRRPASSRLASSPFAAALFLGATSFTAGTPRLDPPPRRTRQGRRSHSPTSATPRVTRRACARARPPANGVVGHPAVAGGGGRVIGARARGTSGAQPRADGSSPATTSSASAPERGTVDRERRDRAWRWSLCARHDAARTLPANRTPAGHGPSRASSHCGRGSNSLAAHKGKGLVIRYLSWLSVT
jgi:hypothetical protein